MLQGASRWALIAGLSGLLASCGGPESADTDSQAATEPEAEVTTPAEATPAAEAVADDADTAATVPEADSEAPAKKAPAADAAPAPAAAKPVASAEPPASFALCAACHAVEAGAGSSFGPNLHGVTGRKAGSLAGYAFSPALQNSGIVWNASSLGTFLEAPQKAVPGTRMAFGGVKDKAKRDEIIAYLATLK